MTKHILKGILLLGGDYMRSTFTTTIEESIQKDFKLKCKENNVKMNDVLETFMKEYINDKYSLEKEYTLKKNI